VKFGNSSIMDICERGTIPFLCQTAEHRALIRLRSSIISIGQLDEQGCQVLASHEVLHIQDHERRLLSKVNCSRICLYVLDLHLVHPVLAARQHDERTSKPRGP